MPPTMHPTVDEVNSAALQHLTSVFGFVQASEYSVIEAFRWGADAQSVQAALRIFDAFRKTLCILRYGHEGAIWGEVMFQDMPYVHELYNDLAEFIRQDVGILSQEVVVRAELHHWNVNHQVHPPNIQEAAEALAEAFAEAPRNSERLSAGLGIEEAALRWDRPACAGLPASHLGNPPVPLIF